MGDKERSTEIADFEVMIRSLLRRRDELRPLVDKVRFSGTGASLGDFDWRLRQAVAEYLQIGNMIVRACELQYGNAAVSPALAK